MKASDVKPAVLHTDGASKGNPGPAGAGFVLVDHGERILAERGIPLGETTVGVAEYKALIAGLSEALAQGIRHIEVYSDSEFMCKQLKGQYRVRTAVIVPLYQWADKLRRRFESFSISHVTRDKNQRADELATEGARLSAEKIRGDKQQ